MIQKLSHEWQLVARSETIMNNHGKFLCTVHAFAFVKLAHLKCLQFMFLHVHEDPEFEWKFQIDKQAEVAYPFAILHYI